MAINGKLFGSIGPANQTNSAQTPETVRPGYGAWYARQMARSYEASQRRTGGTVVALFGDMPCYDLPLAA